MMLGLGDDTIGSGPLDLSQISTVPSNAATGLIVPGSSGDMQVTAVNVGAQTPQNQLSTDAITQFLQEYGVLPQTGSTTSTSSSSTSTWVIIALVVGFGLFLMASSGGSGRRR